MVGLKNINYMSQSRFDSMSDTKDEEIYLVGGPSVDYVVETYVNGNNWYRIYSSGWCEQNVAIVNKSGSAHTATLTWLKPFKDTNYSVMRTVWKNNAANSPGSQWISGFNTKTTTTLTYYTDNKAYVPGDYFYACGYIS